MPEGGEAATCMRQKQYIAITFGLNQLFKPLLADALAKNYHIYV